MPFKMLMDKEPELAELALHTTANSGILQPW